MGINVKVRKYPQLKDVIRGAADLEKDLRNCMHCRFFYNRRQCIANVCVTSEENQQTTKETGEIQCLDCPYRQSERYCFPCMVKVIGRAEG